MKAFPLYFRYALRSFIRGRSRSLFGAFCVAVGIGSVIALGLVGGNFRDTVTGSAQKLNRGDVSITFPGQGANLNDYKFFAQLKKQGKIVDYTPFLRFDAMLKHPRGDQTNVSIGGMIGIDPKKFPFYDTIKANNPSGVPLRQLLSKPNSAVVSKTIYDALHLHIGSPLSIINRFGGSQAYTVRGVVPDNAQDPGFGSGLFPYFAMADISSLKHYQKAENLAATSVYMTTTNAAQGNAVKTALERRFGPLVSPKTVADVQKDSVNGADGFNKFFRIMGLVAVVIGGIGIVNTMLVAARRRTREIAVLKAVGMKSRQVVFVFVLESLFLGIAGTAFGILLGLLASVIVNNITQGMAGYPIPWSIHPDAIIAGVLVGIVATVLFAYVPVLKASRARPVAALRESEGSRKRRWYRRLSWQGFRTLLLVVLLAVLMGYLAVLYTGLVAGIKTVVVGAIVGAATLAVAFVLNLIFVLLVWLVSKSPTFHRLPLRMAFRSMSTQKRRQASTLLALSVGILAIGSIFFLAQNIKHELVQGLQKRQNFNVAIQEPHNAVTLAKTNRIIAGLGGDVTQKYDGAMANLLTLSAVDGQSVSSLISQALTAVDSSGSKKNGKDTVSMAVQNIRALVGRDTRQSADKFLMDKGRNLRPQDYGTNHIIVSNDFADVLGIKLGSRLVYTEPGHAVPFTVVGIASQNNFMTFAESIGDLRYLQKEGLTKPAPSHYATFFLNIKPSRLDADLTALRSHIPGGFVLDLNSFLEFTNVIDKLALFPEIIAALALFAGVIIIANTVALAMLERRREIGVMKAVGARRRTILQFLFVENVIVGFLGAGVGVLLAMLATYLFNKNILQFPTTYDWKTAVSLVILGIVLAVGASSLTALPASSEKPMSVLRYE